MFKLNKKLIHAVDIIQKQENLNFLKLFSLE
jgi:hypothetical protein